MRHFARVIGGPDSGAWATCSCKWESPWFPDCAGARVAKRAHYADTDIDPAVARQLALRRRRFPDARETLVDRCTCGDWRWARTCHNQLCNTNLVMEIAA